MTTAEELSPDEQRAYDLITSNDGLFQSELWKALDATSRKGSRLAMALEEKGFITREQTTNNGQRTYLLIPTNQEPSEPEAEPEEPEEPEDEPIPETTSSESTWDTVGGESDEESRQEPPEETLDEREERALALINERGGIYQSDLWKELDVTSRTGSRIATSLADEGLIRREEVTYQGQRTYLLLPAKGELDFSLLMAGDMISPLVASDEAVDPIDSQEFTQWVLQLAQDAR